MTTTKRLILVVEDDALLRLAAVEIVTVDGYEALEARNADEALAILEARADVRVMFTDVRMAGSMDGLRLAHAVRKRWPPVELIVTSGTALLEPDDLPDRGRFFPKPYDVSALLRAFHELVHGAEPGIALAG